jgi:hypothetical protein
MLIRDLKPLYIYISNGGRDLWLIGLGLYRSAIACAILLSKVLAPCSSSRQQSEVESTVGSIGIVDCNQGDACIQIDNAYFFDSDNSRLVYAKGI